MDGSNLFQIHTLSGPIWTGDNAHILLGGEKGVVRHKRVHRQLLPIYELIKQPLFKRGHYTVIIIRFMSHRKHQASYLSNQMYSSVSKGKYMI